MVRKIAIERRDKVTLSNPSCGLDEMKLWCGYILNRNATKFLHDGHKVSGNHGCDVIIFIEHRAVLQNSNNAEDHIHSNNFADRSPDWVSLFSD